MSLRDRSGYVRLPGSSEEPDAAALAGTSPGAAPTPLAAAAAAAAPTATGVPGASQRFGMRRVSPGPERVDARAAALRKRPAAVAIRTVGPAPGQPLVLRQKDKTVLLPGDTAAPSAAGATGDEAGVLGAPTIFEDLDDGSIGSRGRVTIYCISESLQRKGLEELLQKRYPECRLTRYPDVVHAELPGEGPGAVWSQDLFFFDYGVVCTWGLSQVREQELVQLAKRVAEEPLSLEEVEIDQFQFIYSVHEPPSMSNDCITINRRQAADHQVKLAICHALAQSTKLCVYEERVVDLVLRTKHLPQEMATHGTVRVSAKEVAQLIGQVFLQRSAVNLLSSVLDTPEFFWSAPDSMQVLYERACEYLELETRVEVLNARFEVLQDMLDMLRDYVAHQHSSHLEWIIIYLIAVELVVGLVQLAGLFGILGVHPGGG